MSIEPSAFAARFERSSKLERLSGLLTIYPTTSVTVSDQKASFGGSCPAGKWRTYACLPLSVCPEPSFVVVQYAASPNTSTRGRALAQAARTRIPLPGWPHLGIELQPLTVVVIDLITMFMVTIAVRNASVAPMMIPCTTPECATHARILAMSCTLTLVWFSKKSGGLFRIEPLSEVPIATGTDEQAADGAILQTHQCLRRR